MLRKKRDIENKNKMQPKPSRVSTGPLFASSALHPPTFSTLHNGRPPDSSSFSSSRSSSPVQALQGLRSNPQHLPSAPRTLPRVSSLECLLAEASAASVQFGRGDFSQGSNVKGAGYDDVCQPASPAAIWGAPSAIGLSSQTVQYDHTSHRPPDVRAGNTSPCLAMPPTSYSAYWHDKHQNARPGEDVDYLDFLSLQWPGPPPAYDLVGATGFLSRPASSTSTQLQHQIIPSSTSSQHVPTWPNVCGQCNESNSPIGHVVYESLHHWLVHAWTEHPNEAQWTPRPCFWPNCQNGVLYLNPKKCLDHIASVHVKNIYCAYIDCEYHYGNGEDKVFGTPSDLKRHEEQVHDDPIFCELQYCTHKRVRLNRTDHRKKHMKGFHGSFCCSVTNCLRGRINGIDYGFHTQAFLNEHVQKGRHRTISSYEDI